MTRKIHLAYDGPYSILREIRRNAYLIGDADGNAIGTYNSRQLRPHREARYRADVARIDMLQCVDEQETTQSGKPTSTKEARAVADGKVMDSDADSEIGEAQATHKLYHTVEFPKKRPESRLANRRAGAKSAAVRNVPVNEKGLRHICRIFSVLKGESRVFTAYGHLEDRPVKILFDMR